MQVFLRASAVNPEVEFDGLKGGMMEIAKK